MVKSPKELGSQRWNVAKTIASKTISAVLSVVDSESPSRSEIDTRELHNVVLDLRSELDYWPFEDTEEVFFGVAREAEFDDGPDGVNELGRYISARLVGEADYIVSKQTDDTLDIDVEQTETDATRENGHTNTSQTDHSDDPTEDGVETGDKSVAVDSGESGGGDGNNDEQGIVPPEELGRQRWNVARTLASDIVGAVLEIIDVSGGSVSRSDVDKQEFNEVVESVCSQHNYWPFEDSDEVFDAIDQKSNFSDGPDGVNELGRYISARMVDKTDRVTPNDSYEQFDIEDGSDTEEETEESVEDRNEVVDSASQTKNQDNSSPSGRISVGDGSETFQIATDLYYCFLEQNKKYTEIVDEYGTRFPSRSVLLTDVINTSGSVEERICQIEQYVSEWYQDNEAVEELNQYKRKPMGA